MSTNHLLDNFLASGVAGLKPMSGFPGTNCLKNLFKMILQFAALCLWPRCSPYVFVFFFTVSHLVAMLYFFTTILIHQHRYPPCCLNFPAFWPSELACLWVAYLLTLAHLVSNACLWSADRWPNVNQLIGENWFMSQCKIKGSAWQWTASPAKLQAFDGPCHIHLFLLLL